MKVLVTGANGFVGSHVLDRLHAEGISAVALLRKHSNLQLIQDRLDWAEKRLGAIDDPPSLRRAMEGITHVIHCAGCTKAVRRDEFFAVNQLGTRNMVEAADEAGVSQFVHVSSLAAAGPARASEPKTEADAAVPVSVYGRSKLAGEDEVRTRCRCDYTIIRPPAVYGPRDREFLRLFKAVKSHVRPMPTQQPLSMVYAPDLAGVLVGCLKSKPAVGRTYFAAHPEVTDARQIAREIADVMGGWTIPLPLPSPLFWPLCLFSEWRARLTGEANVLSLQKYAELSAPGWVCAPTLLERELGLSCGTDLRAGIANTYHWYRENQWL